MKAYAEKFNKKTENSWIKLSINVFFAKKLISRFGGDFKSIIVYN